MITTEKVKLPEENIAVVQNSCKYPGVPPANGNYDEAVGKSVKYKE